MLWFSVICIIEEKINENVATNVSKVKNYQNVKVMEISWLTVSRIDVILGLYILKIMI